MVLIVITVAKHDTVLPSTRLMMCDYCGKTGHIKAIYRMKQKTAVGKEPQSVHIVQQEEEVNEYPLFYMGSAAHSKPLREIIAIEHVRYWCKKTQERPCPLYMKQHSKSCGQTGAHQGQKSDCALNREKQSLLLESQMSTSITKVK